MVDYFHSKIIFKSSSDFVYLGNLGKIKSAVKVLLKCGFLLDQKVRQMGRWQPILDPYGHPLLSFVLELILSAIVQLL